MTQSSSSQHSSLSPAAGEAERERTLIQLDSQDKQDFSRWWLAPLTAFLVTRALIVVAVLLGDAILPGFNDTWMYTSGNIAADFVNAWARWDSNWYILVVEQGYHFTPGEMSTIAYFPLYPLLMAALTPLTGSPVLAGLIISNVCFFLALCLLYLLTIRVIGDAKVASRTVFYVAAFPASLFFSAVYAESVFLLLSLAVFLFALRRQWWGAGIMGALASATRVPGVFLAVPMVLEWLSAHGWTLRTTLRAETWRTVWAALRAQPAILLALALVPAGLLLFMLYQQITFGTPTAFFQAYAGWRVDVGMPQLINDIIKLLNGELWVSYILDLLIGVIVLALVVPMWRTLGSVYALYVLVYALVSLVSGVMSFTRYTAVLFPVFMLLAVWGRSRALDMALRVVFLVFLPLFTLAFIKWVFVG